MTMITGSPVGNIITQEELYVDGAPNLFYQNYLGTPGKNPDADGFYWQLSGTSLYPVYALGCVEGVQLADNLTMNDIICDTVGMKNTIMRRNYIELTLNISTIFPLSTVREILRGGIVTAGGGVEKMGLGAIDQNKFFHVYMPKVYDNDTGDYLAIQLHRCRFADAWQVAFRYGNAWQISGIKVRAYADDTLPAAQMFATLVRIDPSAIP
jgi:hypothetical protein